MTSTQEQVTHWREPQCSAWLRHRPGETRCDAQIYVRWIYGVFFYAAGGMEGEPPLRDLCLTAYCAGRFSERPYTLADETDDSCGYCLLALVFHLCGQRQLDPQAMYAVARNQTSGPAVRASFDQVTRQADWEGLEYPSEWTQGLIQRLIDRLFEIQWDSLALELETELCAPDSL
jgi:hypothetical protein